MENGLFSLVSIISPRMFPGYTLLASLQLAAVLGNASFINLHSNVDFDAKAFDLGFHI